MTVFHGKIAFVNLTTSQIQEIYLDEHVFRSYIGGVGLGVKILFENMKPHVDPLGLDNIIGFIPGLLSAVPLPMVTKFSIVSKSPLTQTWGEANSGGLFGRYLKAAGYDGIFFTGKSAIPKYIVISKKKIELFNSNGIWGKDTDQTVELIRQQTNDKKAKIVCIGPAGENLSLISCIITENKRAAGRSGLGAVMGTMKLKAVAVLSENFDIYSENKEGFNQIKTQLVNHLKHDDKMPFIQMLKETGTCSGPLALIPNGASPIKNWTLMGEEGFPQYESIAGENITQFQEKRSNCGNCIINCGGIVKLKTKDRTIRARKPEYETIAAFGSLLLNTNPETIIEANDICDRYGLDTISTGTAIAFGMECYEKNIINTNDTEGIDLSWGNDKAIIPILKKIAKREGFGAILADGVHRASKQIGKGSEQFAIHIHGQEPAMHDPRAFHVRGLGYITGAAPGRHQISTPSIRMITEGRLASYPELSKPSGINEMEIFAKSHALSTIYSQVFSDCGICLFALSAGTDIPLVEMINTVTKWNISIDHLLLAGKRTLTLRQLFNIREGIFANEFNLPDRLAGPPTMGPLKDRNIDFSELKSLFFKSMGWDEKTGVPTDNCLSELEIEQK